MRIVAAATVVSLTVVAVTLLSAPAFADVIVTQNLGPGATSWPATPIVSTMANPSGQATVPESFGGATSYGQTFTLPPGSDYKLETIFVYAGGGSGTTATTTVTLNLYYLGGRVAPNPSAYSPGADLFGGGAGLRISYTPQANGLLRLDFTRSDQVVLRAGRMYAFGISGVSGTTPMNWQRSVADTYGGGAAYRNRAWINGNSARDFGLAVYGTVTSEPPAPTEVTVNAAVSHQQIDGFGAGVVFLDFGLDPLSDAQMDTLYGTGPGQFGLSLIRVRISPTGNWNDALINGRKAHERGARILATPWTPPASMKTNNNIVGGSLLSSEYGNYVGYLNGFLDTMSANGSPVSVISLQNEPDIMVTYESALWTAEQFRLFSRDFAGGINAPVMMPESFRFDQAVSNPTLNDPAAAANVDFIGGHLYGTGVRDYPLARALGKRLWMTEYLVNSQTIQEALNTAEQISDTLTVGNMSAYIWWKTIGNANGLLNATGAPQRRGFVIGQFSRFVRPGDFRIGTSSNTGPLAISAFKDPVTGRFAVVAVNNTTLSETQTVKLGGITTSMVTPWMTSATHSLEQLAPVGASDAQFTFEVPSLAVVTFVGTAAPVLTIGPEVSGTYGEPFTFGITATNSPTSYSASGLAPGLQIDSTTGVISGTPTAAGDYTATITATNDGGSDTRVLAIRILKANASVTFANLFALYDGTPRAPTVTTAPAGLAITLTYNGGPAAIYPGTYTVVATVDDSNYAGTATATLEIGITALVRRGIMLDGSIDGSIQVLSAENAILNGRSQVVGDLLVPGTPDVRLNGQPTFQGVIEGPGAGDPSTYTVTLNGRAALGHVVRRIDPLTIPPVASPPQPSGTRSVTLDAPSDSVGDFATVLNLTLNTDVGLVTVPPGTYGSFAANGGSGFTLGSADASEPSLYYLQNLTLNRGSRIEIAGPVILVVEGGLSVNNGVVFSNHPVGWLTVAVASGGLTLNGNAALNATVHAPSGAVTLNGTSRLRGTVKADRLIVSRYAALVKP